MLCTTFSDFVRAFGDFSLDPGQRQPCTRSTASSTMADALLRQPGEGPATIASSSLHDFEAIDEIAIVAAPGLTERHARRDRHPLQIRTGDRFAILDVAEAVETGGSLTSSCSTLQPRQPAAVSISALVSTSARRMRVQVPPEFVEQMKADFSARPGPATYASCATPWSARC